MAGGQGPFFTPLQPFFRSPVAVLFSFLDPHFDQKCDLLPQNECKVASLYREISLLNISQNNRKQKKIFTKYGFLLDKTRATPTHNISF